MVARFGLSPSRMARQRFRRCLTTSMCATIILAPDRQIKPVGAACVTIEPEAWTAFSILLGVEPEALPETQALADQNGWVRRRWRPGDADDWNDPQVLRAAILDMVAHPLVVTPAAGHVH